jgi:hypothetical protein
MLRAVRKQFIEFEQLVQFLQLQFVIFVIGEQQLVRTVLVEFKRKQFVGQPEQLVGLIVVQ